MSGLVRIHVTARQLGWLRFAAATLLAGLLLAGCQRGGAGSPQGDPGAAQRAAAQESRPPGQQGRPETPTSLLSSIDVGLVYRFILDGYVERVDPTTLIEAAGSGARDTLLQAGALPIDTAPLDLLPAPSGDSDRDWATFSGGLDAVVQRHPSWSRQARPDYEAVRRMLQSLNDNHSSFLTAEEFRRRNETSFSGIGVRIARPEKEGPPVVVNVFRSSPAAAAGLRAGDRILAVGDRSVVQLAISDIADLIRGPQNTEVVLQVQRAGTPDPLSIRAFRRPLTVPDAEGEPVQAGIGYIRIFSFGPTAAEKVGSAILEQRQQGARGWILDLRGNPGGSLDQVTRTAGYLMDARPVAVSVARDGQRQGIFADQRPFRLPPNTPLAVLVDGDTGSGAEVLAAAVKEYQLGSLIGQRTSGSVGIATTRQLSDGSAVQLTISKLTSPGGAQLDRVGVQPDEEVPLAAEDLAAGRDPQRDRAAQILTQRIGR